MIKKLLSIALAISLLPSFSVQAVTTEYDASVFGNNAEYLIEEHFADSTSTVIGGENERIISGWDIDYRGGDVRIHGGALRLCDTSPAEKISLSREFLTVKDGEVVFETGLTVENSVKSKFGLSIGNENEDVFELVFTDCAMHVVGSDGSLCQIKDFSYDTEIRIKAVISIDKGIVSLLIDNMFIDEIPIPATCEYIDKLYMSTGNSEICNVKIHYVNMYRNFIINERFINSSVGEIPFGFSLADNSSASGTAYAPGSPYVDDRNGFSLVGTSADIENILETSFDNIYENTYVSWRMLLPLNSNSINAKLFDNDKELLCIKAENENLFSDNTVIRKNYSDKLWYTFEIEINSDTGTYDIKLNHKTVAENISYPGGIPNRIVFGIQSSSDVQVIIDDIIISKVYEKLADYPTEPIPAASTEANTGMIMYSMWREGMHFGWDTISPYADERKPLMGYYTEGQIEVADWQTKWLSEHGVDYAIYSFVRPSSLSGEPIKQPIRSEDLHGGFLRSEYKQYMNFAIMLTAFGINGASHSAEEQKYHDADEFIENVIPYISEYYFQDPQYMKINNRLPVYSYAIRSMVSVFGTAQDTRRVIEALNNEAISLGYDGIIFCADASSTKAHECVESIGLDYVTIWSYGAQSGNVDSIKTKINSEYIYRSDAVASVPMGYNDTPWRDSVSGLMTPDDVLDICDYLSTHDSYKQSPHKMVTFTCWNEFGEGHYYCPSTIGGFGYLNAIRSVFTADGVKSDEEIPNEESVARMEALYPNGRGMLKRRPDQKYTEADVQNRELLFRKDFNSEEDSPWTYKGNCTAAFVNGSIEAVATNKISGLYFNIENGPDISEVKAMRLKAYSDGEKFFRIYYKTENNTAEGQGKYFDSTAVTRKDGYTEYIMYPNVINEESGNEIPTGRITSIRISPEDNLHLYGQNFGIDYLEMLGDYTEREILLRYEPDDQNIKKMNFTSCSASFTGGSMECLATANDPQIYIKCDTGIDISKVKSVKIKAYTTGCNELRFYYITENNTAYGGGKVFRTTDVSGNSEYTEYELLHGDIGQAPTGKITGFRIDPADDIYMQGATFGIDRIELCGDVINHNLVIDGVDAEFSSPAKTVNGIAYVPVYSVLMNEAGAYAEWDEPTKTLTAEKNEKRLTVTADSHTAEINGRITNLEYAPFYENGNLYVPCEEYFEAFGYDVNYVNSINTFVCETGTDFSLSVRGFDYGENLCIEYANATGSDYVMTNMESGLHVEEVNGESALKLVPLKGGTDGLFTVRCVNIGGIRKKLDDVIKLGGKIKVSFQYMGVCSQVSIENRSGNSIDQSAKKIAISDDKWTEFSYVFDNSTINVTDARWLTLRIKSTAGQSPYLYVKDFKIQSYEETELKTYESDVNIILTAPTGSPDAVDYTLFVAGYDDSGKLISLDKILEGNTGDVGENITEFTYTPDGSSTVKMFLWSDFKPLYIMKELHKR